MAGMAPISLQQRISPNGRPYVGARADFYAAETLERIDLYANNDLSVPLPNPVETDGYGMFPAIFIDAALGFYRFRVTTSSGVILTDLIQLPIYDQPDGGGDPVTPVDTDAVMKTGDVKWRYGTGSHPGYVRVNGRTIGAASSGAGERANDDCEALFLHLWGANAYLDVSGGRGGSAAADWAANKRLTLPDARGIALIGMTDMGSTDSERISPNFFEAGDGTALGSYGGADAHEIGPHDLTRAGTVDTYGATGAHNNMPPFMVGTFYIKL
jgi:hypothetical protein